MSVLRRLSVFAANLGWLISCLPGAAMFLVALRWPRFAQERKLSRLLSRHRNTRFGHEHGFGRLHGVMGDFYRLPLANYESFRPAIEDIQSGAIDELTTDPVQVLQPTSGSSGGSKLIPFTAGLRREFHAALAPWIASLYALRPRLLFGRHYWCLSPNTRPAASAGAIVPTGFTEDTAYLGVWQRWFARRLLVAPPELAQVHDPAAFEFLTLLFLVREENLRLISVWHPSFLTLLVEALPRHALALAACLREGDLPASLPIAPDVRTVLTRELKPDQLRAGLVARQALLGPEGCEALWPHLQVISCWTGKSSEPWVSRLRAWFPRAALQGKGLLATEGVVTIPWGLHARKVCAVRSHFLEFADTSTGNVYRSWELVTGKDYGVVLTTAGGLYRYRLGDRVRVTGWVSRTPCLEFLNREGIVSDLCGEKLTVGDAEAAFEHLHAMTGVSFNFAMFVPSFRHGMPGYVFVFQIDTTIRPDAESTWIHTLDEALQRNFHYRHARQLGQLHPIRLYKAYGDVVTAYRQRLLQLGLRQGDIKFLALRVELDWPDILPGEWIVPTATDQTLSAAPHGPP